MRCDCVKCENNEDGYCETGSYVRIDENGFCESMLISSDVKEPKNAE